MISSLMWNMPRTELINPKDSCFPEKKVVSEGLEGSERIYEG